MMIAKRDNILFIIEKYFCRFSCGYVLVFVITGEILPGCVCNVNSVKKILDNQANIPVKGFIVI